MYILGIFHSMEVGNSLSSTSLKWIKHVFQLWNATLTELCNATQFTELHNAALLELWNDTLIQNYVMQLL